MYIKGLKVFVFIVEIKVNRTIKRYVNQLGALTQCQILGTLVYVTYVFTFLLVYSVLILLYMHALDTRCFYELYAVK